MPSDNFSRPTSRKSRKQNKGKSKTQPVPNVAASVGVGKNRAAAKTTAAPSFGRPLTPSFPTSVPSRKPAAPPKPFGVHGGIPINSPRHAAAADVRRARQARAQQVHGAARRDVLASLGLGPRRTVTSVGFAPSPPMYIGPRLLGARDSGVANNHGPSYRGVALSPQQITRDMARVLRPGASVQKQRSVERLQAAGVVDPFGTTTRREGLDRARQAFLSRYRELQDFDFGVGQENLSDAEVMARLRGRSRPEIEAAVAEYQPSSYQLQASRTQTMGLSGNPLKMLAAIPQALGTAASGAGELIRDGYGKNVASNFAADALYLPIGAVGAAAMAASDPAAAWEGIKNGVIGSLIQGDTEGAKRMLRDHPLFALMELHGGASAVGRTAGVVGRGVSGGRVFSTERAPLAFADLPGTQLYDRRRYSKDVFRQGVQRATDRLLQDGPEVLLNGRPVRSKLSPSQAHSNWRMRRMADYVASRANSRERVNREEMAREALRAAPVRSHKGGVAGRAVGEWLDRTLPSAPRYGEGRLHFISKLIPKQMYRGERDVVTMVLEGVVRSPKTFVTDLRKERSRLETEFQNHRAAAKSGDTGKVLDKADAVANRQRAAAIDRVLDNPKAMNNAEGVFASARRLAPRFRELEQEAIERGALNPVRAARSRVFTTAQAHQKATYDLEGQRLVIPDRNGEGSVPVSNRQILEEFQRQGGDPELLTYLPHTMRLRGPSAYHQHFGQQRRNYEGSQTRTGEMFRRGSSPFDYEHVVDTLVGKSNLIGNIREYDLLLQATGIRHKDGRYLTGQEAYRWLKNGKDEDGNPLPPDLVAKRAFNSRSSDEQLAKIEQQQQVARGEPATAIEQHYRDRSVLPDDGSRARNVVLIPATIDGRLQSHIGVAGKATASFQAAQGLFRRAVLPLSTKWMFGNLLEAVIRSSVAGVAPVRDNLLGRKVIKALVAQDKRTGKAFEAELIGGLNIGNRGLANNRGPSTRNVPLVNEVVESIKLATDAGFAFNRMIEREFQYAVLGKAARQQMQEMTGFWTKAMRAQRTAVDELARGLRETPAQIQFARYMDQTLGQYSRFSPQMRGLIQTYMPFLPWTVNSVRFVAWTLPAKHPLKTALLTRVEEQFQADYEQQHDDALTRKGDLATAIKTEDGGYVPAARYTPFGFLGPMAAGDLSDLPGLVMPQISGPLLAMRGIDPFGEEMVIPKKYGGTGERIEGFDAGLVALNQLLESFVPGVSIGRRLREGGETALPTSTIFETRTKPGSSHGQSALERVFSPLRPIYLRGKQGGGEPVDPVDAILDGIDLDAIDDAAVDQALEALGY